MAEHELKEHRRWKVRCKSATPEKTMPKSSKARSLSSPEKAATALDRYGRVDEIAAAVAFIAGPESSYITGSNRTVDGGMNA
jgi:NAD(P)-dependent dehydrogenase (short-subunit alcohol dehydrogenase family)